MLSFLKPETSNLQPEKVKKKFLSKIYIFTKNNQILANMSHWEGQIATWKPYQISLDPNGKLHGVCGFELLPEFYNKSGTLDFFHWSLKHFSGRFVHGKLLRRFRQFSYLARHCHVSNIQKWRITWSNHCSW